MVNLQELQGLDANTAAIIAASRDRWLFYPEALSLFTRHRWEAPLPFSTGKPGPEPLITGLFFYDRSHFSDLYRWDEVNEERRKTCRSQRFREGNVVKYTEARLTCPNGLRFYRRTHHARQIFLNGNALVHYRLVLPVPFIRKGLAIEKPRDDDNNDREKERTRRTKLVSFPKRNNKEACAVGNGSRLTNAAVQCSASPDYDALEHNLGEFHQVVWRHFKCRGCLKGKKNQEGSSEDSLEVKGLSRESDATEVWEAYHTCVVPELYNNVDFANALFCITKPFSEDNVHKTSILNGNKKLAAAYHEAQQKPGGCPIFLFYSVNASGLFVGLTEVSGLVDFNTAVEYWQQDKWTGYFPLKWFILKDVPKNLLKHITLENKPVINSRGMQEVSEEKTTDQNKECATVRKESSSAGEFDQ